MSIADVREDVHRLRPPWRGHRMDYKQKLQQKLASATRETGPDEGRGDEEGYARQVCALAADAGAGRIAFQSVAVTALQLLDRVLSRDRAALGAALSLAQREKLRQMMVTIEKTARALREALSEQGAQMLHLCAEREEAVAGEEDGSWWFALTEAIEALEDGARRMDSLASGQPEEGVSRCLGELIAQLLRKQHADLLLEAEQWIA